MKPADIVQHELEHLQRSIESGKGGWRETLRQSRTTLFILPVAIGLLHWWKVPAQLSKATLDAAITMQPKVEPANVRLLAIDDRDYADLFASKSPLNVTELSRILAALAKGKPALVVVDIDTSDRSFRELTVPSSLKIVWAMSDEGQEAGKFVAVPPLGDREMRPLWSKGLAEAPNDGKGVVRGYRRVFATTDGFVRSLPFAAADAYRGHQISSPVPEVSENDRRLDFRYLFYPLSARSVISYAQEEGWPEGVLRGTVVILGGTYRSGRDQYATPVGLKDGLEIVGQATQSEIDGTGISLNGTWLGILEIVGALLVLAVYQLFRLRAAVLLSVLLIPALAIGGSYLLYGTASAWLVLMPVLVLVMLSELYAKAAMYQELSGRLTKAIRREDASAPDPNHEAELVPKGPAS